MMTDPIADLLARIRNAGVARHARMSCPASKLKKAVAQVLQSEGFLEAVGDAETAAPHHNFAVPDPQGRGRRGDTRTRDGGLLPPHLLEPWR